MQEKTAVIPQSLGQNLSLDTVQPRLEALPPHSAHLIEPNLKDLLNYKMGYHLEGLAEHSARALKSDTGLFMNWCIEHQYCAVPAHPLTVRLYLWQQAPHKAPNTLSRYLASINQLHKLVERPKPSDAPEVQAAMKLIRAESQYVEQQAVPARYAQIDTLSHLIDAERPQDVRDYALLLVAHSTLLRRSELSRITVEDLDCPAEEADGLIQVAKIKGKKGTRETYHAYLSPPARTWLLRWLAMGGIQQGPVFRSVTKYGTLRMTHLDGEGVRNALNRLGQKIGASFTGHSARVGAAQDMVAQGIETSQAMQAGRWQDHKTFMRYVARLQAKDGGMAQFFKRC